MDSARATNKMGSSVGAHIWFEHADRGAVLREMKVLCDSYGYILTLLHLSPSERVWPPLERIPIARVRVHILTAETASEAGLCRLSSAGRTTFALLGCRTLSQAPTHYMQSERSTRVFPREARQGCRENWVAIRAVHAEFQYPVRYQKTAGLVVECREIFECSFAKAREVFELGIIRARASSLRFLATKPRSPASP